MSERGVTALLALLALALFYVLFGGAGRGGAGLADVSRPTTVETAGNGYWAAFEWLQREGVPVRSLREAFQDGLGEGRGDLLIVTLPGVGTVRTEELAALDRWVRRGNTLLVLAGLSDSPEWAYPLAPTSAFDLTALTGLELESLPARRTRLEPPEPVAGRSEGGADGGADAAAGATGDTAEDRAEEVASMLKSPVRHRAMPARDHPLLEPGLALVGISDYPRTPWVLRTPYDEFALELARDADSGEGVLWLRELGEGRILVSAYGSLLTNRVLREPGNARFLSRLVGWSVGPRGRVLFDDGHQGVSPTYDAREFYADRRLHLTIAVLVGFWFLWVLGSTRLRTPVLAVRAPSDLDLLRATSDFFARVLRPGLAAQRMFEHFFNALRQRLGLPRNGESLWDWLEAPGRVPAADLEALKSAYAAAHAGRPIRLRELHNLLIRLRRQLA